jgi:GTP-binding protein
MIEEIKYVEFKGSFVKNQQCPQDNLPEFAFIGRSNVGKSSLINMLTNRKKLAKISATPGKTQTINYFLVDESWYLVDLPGYGYAKTSKKNRKEFNKIISEYIIHREQLDCLFMLLDSRLPLQKNDAEFMEWLGEHQIPFVIVYTKADKLSFSRLEHNIKNIQKELENTWEFLPKQFQTSSFKKAGKEDILEFIDETIQILEKNS